MDYRDLLGIRDLAGKALDGAGVCVAVLDSGTPARFLFPEERCASYRDNFGHATEIASILFGAEDIGGVCRFAQPFFSKVLDDRGFGSAKSVARGILRAIDHQVDIINLSLGFKRTEKCPRALEKACERAFEAGIPVICAAGNDGASVNWPAALETTICVGSAGENGLKATFSSSGEVDFVAPGENLPVIGIDGQKKRISGTSYSTAIVTGVSALLIRGLKRSYSTSCAEVLKSALKAVATDVDESGWDARTGYGYVGDLNVADVTVDLKTKRGVFAIIFDKIRAVLGLNKKE
jgi:subtilisin family serine protease